MLFVRQIKCSWLIPHEQAICFSSLIWLSRKKSVKKSRFSRMVKNFHFLIWISKHFDFTFLFSKKSESIFFHFSLLKLQKPTLAGPWLECNHLLFLVIIDFTNLEYFWVNLKRTFWGLSCLYQICERCSYIRRTWKWVICTVSTLKKRPKDGGVSCHCYIWFKSDDCFSKMNFENGKACIFVRLLLQKSDWFFLEFKN